MTVDRPLAAPVRGFAAAVIVGDLRAAGWPGRIERLSGNGLDSGYVRELRAAWADLRSARQQWEAWQASNGSSGGVGSDSAASSPEVTTGEAAVLLDVSASRVRQLCRSGGLDAHRSHCRWLVSRVSVEVRKASR